jgi:putative ABC transport system substrate-binding protein
MKRREFIAALGGASAFSASSQFVASAQQQGTPVIGFLHSRTVDPGAPEIVAFHRGLGEGGYADGRNVTVEYRWGNSQYERMAALASELVRRPVDLLLTFGGEPSALAAKAATSSIPILVVVGSDPVALGLVTSFNRPGGNISGVSIVTAQLEPKRLGLLRELVPQAKTVAVLVNPNFPSVALQLQQIQQASASVGLTLQVLRASRDVEIDAAFGEIVAQGTSALLVASDPYFLSRAEKIVALAERHQVPTVYQFRQFAQAGGLMSYGVNLPDAYRQVGIYAGRILKGAKPADLPVVQLDKFELVINMKSAKALGLTVPSSMQLLADEVIE